MMTRQKTIDDTAVADQTRAEQSRAAAAVRSTYDAAAGYTNSVASKCEQCVRLLGLALVFSCWIDR
jgi:hypothetical protein